MGMGISIGIRDQHRIRDQHGMRISMGMKTRVYCSVSGCPEAQGLSHSIFIPVTLTLGQEIRCIFRKDGMESYLPWISSRGERPLRYLSEPWAFGLFPSPPLSLSLPLQ